MYKWRKAATWSMLVIAIVVFMAAVFVLGSTLGRMLVLGEIELSIPQIGIICGGITSLSVFKRCVNKLKSRSELGVHH
ncbi:MULTISPECIES: hypothetical protein [Alteromonadaceae]|uniref:hypothetical protein n=1 Tax=Alteromonadaceae TaxID=72275 RepID=UPI00319E9A31